MKRGYITPFSACVWEEEEQHGDGLRPRNRGFAHVARDVS